MAIYGVDFYGTSFYGAPLFLEFDARPFTAETVGHGELRLDWVNPSGDWDLLRVVRSSYGYPGTEIDGLVVLEQTNNTRTSLTDSAVKPGKFLYYSIFVRETENGVWVRAADTVGLPTEPHGYGQKLFSLMPAFLQEADGDRVRAAGEDGPLRRVLEVFGASLDHSRTEYETLRWLRNPDQISGNLLPLLAHQYGIPNEPALGMRQTRVWLRDAVYLYRYKGTRPGVEAAASAITGWGARVTFSKNLVKAEESYAWYVFQAILIDDVSPDDPSIPALEVSSMLSNTYWKIGTIPDADSTSVERWMGFPVTEGLDYSARASVRPFFSSQAGTTMRWLFRWFDDNGDLIQQDASATTASVFATWTQVPATFNAPAGAARLAVFLESTYSAAASARHYLRRIQVEQAAAPSVYALPSALVINFDPVRWNLIPNPSFENGLFGWVVESGSASPSDTELQGLSGGRSMLLNGEVGTQFLGLATMLVPHVFSAFLQASDPTNVTLRVEWYEALEDEDPVSYLESSHELPGDDFPHRFDISGPAPAGVRLAKVFITTDGPAFVDHTMFEEGSVAGDYFDGSFFGADWLWSSIAHASASKFYPGRTERNYRVRELLPNYLPLNQKFILNYIGGAPAGGALITGDEGNVGVGTYGIMPFGQ
jgi:hypothetical protein